MIYLSRMIVFFAVYLLWTQGALLAGELDQSIVLVEVTKQPSSIESPWEKQAVRPSHGLGVVVENGDILVTAYSVIDAKLIEIKQIGKSTYFEAKVKFSDREANLALLELVQKNAIADLEPVDLGKNSPIGSAANLYSAPKGGKFILHQAYLSAVGVYKASTSMMNVVNYLYKVQESGLGWSEPVLSDGKLVALTAGQSREYVYAIPAFVIRHFLGDAHNEKYRGFPGLGVTSQSLGPGNLRTLLNADKTPGGVRVTDISPSGPFSGVLAKDDVLLQLNEFSIDGEGTIDHPLWGRIPYPAILNTMFAGDEITIKFLRNGEAKFSTARLSRFDSNSRLMPYYRLTERVPHLIFGGFVFQEVTHEYLQAWGDSWRQTAPSRLVHMWDYENSRAVPEGQRVVILNRVMADEFNFGYSDLSDIVVQGVNGKPVTSLVSLEENLREPLKQGSLRFTQVSLADGNGDIIVGYDSIDEVNARIAETYGVGSGATFFRLNVK